MTSENEHDVIVYDVVSVPSRTGREAPAQDWLREDGRWMDGLTGECAAEVRAARHPAWGRVAGFAAGRLRLNGTVVHIEKLQVSVGDEKSALVLANRAVARVPGHRVTYSAKQWAARFLIARTFLSGLPSRTTIGGLAGNVIDLADIIALGGLVEAPPLHLLADQLGLGESFRPATMPELEMAVRTGSHARLLVEMIGRVRTLAWLWSLMYLGPEYVVAPLDLREPEWIPPSEEGTG